MRAGLDSYLSGNPKKSVDALKFAADGGESLARWKLGRMYADGDGVTRDDIKAYQYFSQIVADYDDDEPGRRETAIVSSAYVALGVYTLSGIPNSRVKANPERAAEMFQYAATNFGDSNAQYNLGRLYLEGTPGFDRDTRQATRWLSLAAEKGNASAQALLGQLLFNGQDGVLRQRARGLMWLTLARDAASGDKDQLDRRALRKGDRRRERSGPADGARLSRRRTYKSATERVLPNIRIGVGGWTYEPWRRDILSA